GGRVPDRQVVLLARGHGGGARRGLEHHGLAVAVGAAGDRDLHGPASPVRGGGEGEAEVVVAVAGLLPATGEAVGAHGLHARVLYEVGGGLGGRRPDQGRG